MNSLPDRPRLRLAWTGIASLFSLFPTLLYFMVSGTPGLEAVLRKKEALLDGFLLFGGLQAFAFVVFTVVIILIWRPKKANGPKLVKKDSEKEGGQGGLMLGLLKKLVASLGVLIVGFIPLWVFLLTKAALGPAEHWKDLATVGFCSVFLGGLQVFLAIRMASVLLNIWLDDPW